MTYDLIVVGAGPAGYLAAERAGHAGLKVLLVEKRFIGGVCLNEGCIPSKTLLHSAKVFDYARHGDKYGVSVKEASLDHSMVIKRKNKVVKTLVAGINSVLKASGVVTVNGEALIKGRSEKGFEIIVGDEEYIGNRLLIATGSEPVIPPIAGTDNGISSGFVLTNREILDLQAIPQSLVVIGGGVIGMEMASYFNSAGSSVTVIEMLDHIAGNTDRDIRELLMKEYTKKGIIFKLSSRVIEIGDGFVVYENNGQETRVDCGKVLLSIGRKAVTKGLGLENIGVELERGVIKTDEYCRTNVPGVYAAGDVNGKSMLAHTAYREAEVSVNNMLGIKTIMRYNAIPNVIYTNPEVAGIGETEESAREKGISYKTANISMRYSGRYIAENEGGNGICKILVDKEKNRIIGAHIITNYSSEFIYGIGIMIENEMRIEDIRELVFPHPTVSEIIREAIFSDF